MLNPFAKSFSLDQFEQQKSNTSSTSSTNQESALTDCHFFMSGVCNKGNLCQFRHSEAAKQAGPFAQNCDAWLNYNCWDAECPRRHPARKANPQETICWFFVNQTCSHGNRCHFIHPIVDKNVKDKNKTKQISLDELDTGVKKTNPPRQAPRTQPKKGAILSFSLADLEDDTPPAHKNSPPLTAAAGTRSNPFSDFGSGNSEHSQQPAPAKQQVEAPPAKKASPSRVTKAAQSPKTPAPAEDKTSPTAKKTSPQKVVKTTPQNTFKKTSPSKTPTTTKATSLPSSTKTITPGKRKRTDTSASTQQTKKAKITPKSSAKPAAKPAKKVSEEDDELAFLEGLI